MTIINMRMCQFIPSKSTASRGSADTKINKLQNEKGLQEPCGSLKECIAEIVDTIFKLVQTVGRMDMDFFRQITANTNTNANSKAVYGRLIG